MLEALNRYPWHDYILQEFSAKPSPVMSATHVCADGFTVDDVKRVIALQDGENDGLDWLGVFELNDGRFASAVAGCDYTGFDCQGGGVVMVAATEADIINLGLTPEERERLGLKEPEC